MADLPTESEPVTVVEGDCLDVLRGLPDGCVDAVVTDPPYAITGDTAIAISRQPRRLPPETQFFASWLREHVAEWVRVVRPEGAVWLTLDWRGCVVLDEVAARLGVRRAPVVGVWDKKRMGMGATFRRRYETFAVLPMDGFSPPNHSEPDVWECTSGGGHGGEHPAAKPVDLMGRAVRFVAPHGGLILDPFAGSGTTGVAAVAEGRRCLLVERDPVYAAVARRRVDEAMGRNGLFAGAG